ncbi:MAG TPA: ATP-binding protein [Thermoleophilaceae bacterium]|nr:ATP-binding protein [Thermoleophilaceae bacterium]
MVSQDENVGTVELLLGDSRDAATLRLTAGDPGVAVIRQFVGGMAEALGIHPAGAEDVKLAATEAATNALMHAWPDGEVGRIEVVLLRDSGGVVLTISDDGTGVTGEGHDAEIGFGLSLIRAVADDVDVREAKGGGTRVEARFRDLPRAEAVTDSGHSPALRRVLAMMAAQCGFTMDRLSDAVLVAETLAAHAGAHSVDGRVRVAAEDGAGDLRLLVGPLTRGGGQALLDESTLPAFGGVLERLADGVEVDRGIGPAGPCEYLRVRISSRR